MNCPDCDRLIAGTRCACGWKPKSTAATTPQAFWLTAHCATTDCNTTIRWPYNQPKGPDLCKWCQARARGDDEFSSV